MPDMLALLKELMQRPSVTPNDAGCQEIIADRLQKLGFHIERMPFGDVENLWARLGKNSPLVVFAGHTDVVPPGPLEAWESDPFEPTVRNGLLYGRGASDMKSGLAAMITAVENFLKKYPTFPGSIGFLITSDEEGPSTHGTKKVIETLIERGEKIDYCIIGEATSEQTIGDQIRVGRRGSLNGKLVIQGLQGHVAFPHLAKNPIHEGLKALNELTQSIWDKGNEYFPATTFQISNIHAGNGALNVIPGSLEVNFNFRFSSAITVDELQKRLTTILQNNRLDFDLHLNNSAMPFLSKKGKLIQATQKAIQDLTGLSTMLSTGGGTSDGRFIAPTGTEVIELGPINASVHQANEHVRFSDLEKLATIYEKILENLFS